MATTDIQERARRQEQAQNNRVWLTGCIIPKVYDNRPPDDEFDPLEAEDRRDGNLFNVHYEMRFDQDNHCHIVEVSGAVPGHYVHGYGFGDFADSELIFPDEAGDDVVEVEEEFSVGAEEGMGEEWNDDGDDDGYPTALQLKRRQKVRKTAKGKPRPKHDSARLKKGS